MAEEDWDKACETRTERDRRHLARIAGSCERAFAAVMKDKATDVFEDIEARDVRIEGDKAGVDIHQPGQRKPALTLVAVPSTARALLL